MHGQAYADESANTFGRNVSTLSEGVCQVFSFASTHRGGHYGLASSVASDILW